MTISFGTRTGGTTYIPLRKIIFGKYTMRIWRIRL